MRRSDSPLSPRAHLQIFTFHLPDPRISSPKLSDFRIPPLLNDSLSFIDQPSPNWFHSPSVLFFSSAVVDTHPLQISSHLHFLGCLLLAGFIESPPVCSHQCGGLSLGLAIAIQLSPVDHLEQCFSWYTYPRARCSLLCHFTYCRWVASTQDIRSQHVRPHHTAMRQNWKYLSTYECQPRICLSRSCTCLYLIAKYVLKTWTCCWYWVFQLLTSSYKSSYLQH